MKLNFYENWTKPTVVKDIKIDQYLNLVKYGTSKEHIDDITYIRQFDKKHQEYNKLKSQTSCVTINYLYDGYKKDDNVIVSTGLLMYDIDDPLYDITTLDKELIYFFHKSFGGKGYTIVVKVKNLDNTREHYDSSFIEISKELNIHNFIDKGAKKRTQFTVLSYDENLFINADAHTFDCNNFSKIVKESKVIKIPPTVNNNKITLYSKGGIFDDRELDRVSTYKNRKRLRFNNSQDYITREEYVTDFGEGFSIIEAVGTFNNYKIPSGKRSNYLLGYTVNLVFLNKDMDITKEMIFGVVSSINENCLSYPLPLHEVNSIISNVFKYLKNGTLKPIIRTKNKRIIFNEKLKWDRDTKMRNWYKENSKNWEDKSTQRIYEMIEDWDFETLGKITQLKIVKNNSISKKTVQKYWKHFKDYVKDLNNIEKKI